MLKRTGLFETTIAGSLPKPAWLAKPRMLWAPWQLNGDPLVEAKRDATVLVLKERENAGIDIVADGTALARGRFASHPG
jgi:5-methyltetrahydropteroyltriglutamate--homocysteine methyltransferase